MVAGSKPREGRSVDRAQAVFWVLLRQAAMSGGVGSKGKRPAGYQDLTLFMEGHSLPSQGL